MKGKRHIVREVRPSSNLPVIRSASKNNGEDGIETFQEFVDRVTAQAVQLEQAKKSKKCGRLRKCINWAMCCGGFDSEKKESVFWIEPAPGYPERRCKDL